MLLPIVKHSRQKRDKDQQSNGQGQGGSAQGLQERIRGGLPSPTKTGDGEGPYLHAMGGGRKKNRLCQLAERHRNGNPFGSLPKVINQEGNSASGTAKKEKERKKGASEGEKEVRATEKHYFKHTK